MVQMRGNTGAVEQAQRTQSVSPIGLVVNGLHCAASHTHTRLLSGHPHVPTFEPCPNFPHPALRRASPSGPRMRPAAHPSPADASLSATCEPVMGLLDIAA